MPGTPARRGRAGGRTQGGAETRPALLEAAGRVFAQRGFHDATVREIVAAARANIAAVNYHFGDKQGLYRAVLSHAFEASESRVPAGSYVDAEGLSAEVRLGVFVRGFLAKLLDPGKPGWHARLMAREMVEPTGALESVARRFMKPVFEGLRAIVAELLGPRASAERVRLCAASIIAQCVFYENCRAVIGHLMPEQRYDESAKDRLAEHITTISLAGIRGMRPAGRRGAGAGKKRWRKVA